MLWSGWLTTSLSWVPLCLVSMPSQAFPPALRSRVGNTPPCQSEALSLVQIHQNTALELVEITVLKRQLSCAIKTQLKALKVLKAFLAF